MKINIFDIPSEGLKIEEKVELSSIHLDGLSSISVWAKMERLGERVDVRMKLKADLKLECSRCLGSFDREVKVDFDLFYLPMPRQESWRGLEQEVELKEEDFKVAFYQKPMIDLGEEVRQAVLLALPAKPLCRPDCRGLCPLCGKDLNKEECNCQREEIDPRMEGLRKYLEK